MSRVVTLCLVAVFSFTRAANLEDNLLQQLEVTSFCYSRANATHMLGCGVDSTHGVLALAKEAKSGQVAILCPGELRQSEVFRLRDKVGVSALLLVSNASAIADCTDLTPDYSEDRQCPGQEEACDPIWNPSGDALALLHIRIPFFYVRSPVDTVRIVECMEKHPLSSSRPCSVLLKLTQQLAGDAVRCHSRNKHWSSVLNNNAQYCSPNQGVNLFATTRPTNETRAVKSVTLVTARLDADSLFYNATPGLSDPVGRLAVLLSVIDALSPLTVKMQEADMEILFAFFDGESVGNIGSSQFVHGFSNGSFTINSGAAYKPEDISTVIEVGQFNPALTTLLTLYCHNVRGTACSTIAGVTPATTTAVPPSSYPFLLKDRKFDGADFLLVSDFDTTFSSPSFYHSTFDTATRYPDLDLTLQSNTVTRLTSLAQLLATHLHQLLKLDTTTPAEVDRTFVYNFLHCFDSATPDKRCRWLDEAEQKFTADKWGTPSRQYQVGVSPQRGPRHVNLNVWMLLGSRLRTVVTLGSCESQGQGDSFTYWKDGDNCSRSAIATGRAISPAFTITDYNLADNTGGYSLMSESIWDGQMTLALFISNPIEFQVIPLILGVLLTLLTVFLTKCGEFYVTESPEGNS